MSLRNCLALAAMGALATTASAATYTRVCVLTGTQESSPNTSPGMGCGRFVIDTCANTLTYRIVVGGLTSAETAAHIHGASDPGVSSGIVHPLPAGPVKVGVWNYPEAMEADILNGRMYVNVHTVNFGPGEVRGQIVTHVALLDGGQEQVPVASAGRGFGLFNLDFPNQGEMKYYISYGGLTGAETAAHIHGLSLTAISSGIVHPLPAASPKVGVWTYPAAMRQDIVNGRTYVNIHTTFAGGGEIRGQIVASVNPMDGTQEQAVNASPTIGCGLCSIDTATNTLGFDVQRTALGTAETAAHIHGYSPQNVSSGIVFGLAATPRKLGQWAYGAANSANVLAELTYFNIHSVAIGGGEIRGQIRWPLLAGVTCVADVDDGSGTGTPDGGVTIDDLIYYLGLFEAGDSGADVDDGSGGGCTDGGVTIDDLIYYLTRFESGC